MSLYGQATGSRTPIPDTPLTQKVAFPEKKYEATGGETLNGKTTETTTSSSTSYSSTTTATPRAANPTQELNKVVENITALISNPDIVMGSSKQLADNLSKIDTLIDQASDQSTLEADKQALRGRMVSSKIEAMSNHLAMLAGVQGAGENLAASKERYYKYEYMLRELEINPDRSLAVKKLSMLNDMSNYIKSLGEAIGYTEPDVANMLNFYGNHLQSKAAVDSARIQAGGMVTAARINSDAAAFSAIGRAKSSGEESSESPLKALMGAVQALQEFTGSNQKQFTDEQKKSASAALTNILSAINSAAQSVAGKNSTGAQLPSVNTVFGE